MADYQSYIVCTSPRSGSTLLCRLLAATGKSGNPDSHFHRPSLQDWMRYYKLSAENYDSERELLVALFQAARARGTGSTGLFGLRLQAHSFEFFIQKLRELHPENSVDSQCIRAVFGRTLFIHLTRKNKLDQAISYVKASQSGLWHKAPDGTELERVAAHKEPIYDGNAIADKLAELHTMDKRWDSWFNAEGLNPLCIDYDELSSNPIAVVRKVLVRLGLDHDLARALKIPVAKLADEQSRRWAKRFLAE